MGILLPWCETENDGELGGVMEDPDWHVDVDEDMRGDGGGFNWVLPGDGGITGEDCCLLLEINLGDGGTRGGAEGLIFEDGTLSDTWISWYPPLSIVEYQCCGVSHSSGYLQSLRFPWSVPDNIVRWLRGDPGILAGVCGEDEMCIGEYSGTCGMYVCVCKRGWCGGCVPVKLKSSHDLGSYPLTWRGLQSL